MSRIVFSRAFASFGSGSVIVAPRRLKGVRNIRIGSACAVFEGAWLQCEDAGGSLEIGDRVYLGHDVHLHSMGEISIGDDCMLVDRVVVSNGRHYFNGGWPVEPMGPITIGQRVWIGTGVTVLGGVEIGDDAVIGAHAVVTRDVPAGAVAAGVPARVLREETVA